jgi:hypothetical protein
MSANSAPEDDVCILFFPDGEPWFQVSHTDARLFTVVNCQPVFTLQGRVIGASPDGARRQLGLVAEPCPAPESAHACCLGDNAEFFALTVIDFAAGTEWVTSQFIIYYLLFLNHLVARDARQQWC